MAYHCPRCQHQQGRSRIFVATVVVVLAVLAVLASVIPSVVIRSLGFQSHVKNLDLAPGGTSVVNYSSIYCSELTLAGDNMQLHTASLYLLNNTQPIRGSTLNVQTQLYIDRGKYKHWNFGLLPETNISLSVCAVFAQYMLRATQARLKTLPADSEVVVLYFIEGETAFEKKKFKKNYTIPIKYCTSPDVKFFNWTISEANTYYLVFQNDANSSIHDDVRVHINMTIDRMKYKCTGNSRSDRNDDCGCKVSGTDPDSCRVTTDLKEHYTAAVTIDAENTMTFQEWGMHDYFHLRVSCDPRWWFYTVMAVSGLILFLTPAFIVAATYLCYVAERKYVRAVQEHPPATEGLGPQPMPATINPGRSSTSPYSQQPFSQEQMWQHQPHTAASSKNTSSDTPLSPSSHLLQHHVHASPQPVQSGRPMAVNKGGHYGSTGESLQTLAACSSQWQLIDDERVALLKEEKEGEEEEEEGEEEGDTS